MKSNVEQLNIAKKYLGDSCPKCCHMGNNCCCYFVSKIFREAGNASLFYGGQTVTYCPNAIKWCKAHLAEIPPYIALPSDIIFFDWELNGTPNHIGFVNSRVSASQINTLEGNTGRGIVAYRTREEKYIQGIYRPHFAPTSYSKTAPLVVDSYFGYNSIAMLQKALGVKQDAILGRETVKALQKKAGLKGADVDGRWGKKTSKAIQKMTGAKVDGWFGEESVKKLQTWINKVNGKTDAKPTTTTKPTVTKPTTPVKKPTVVKKTKAEQINETAQKFAWKAGTPESVYDYPKGKPTKDFIAAWKKFFPKKKMNCGCHQYVNLVIKACGYKGFPSYLWKSSIIPYLKKNFQEIKVNYTQGQLKPGDIRVHKNAKGGYHIWIIVKTTDGKYYRAEANQQGNKRYAHINVHNGGNTKHHKQDWLFRAK